jgi:uridine kinase
MSTDGRIEDRVCVIGIAGGSGSGKTTISGHLASTLGEDRVARLSQDSYYHDGRALSVEQARLRNYDHPAAIDSPLLAEHLRLLRGAQAVDVPCYDFATHSRRSESTRVDPRPIVLVEGILLLSEVALRRCLTVRLYVEADDDTRLLRRIRRDTLERGRDLNSVLDQWETSVKPMHDRFVAPSRRWADLVIADGCDREASLQMLLDSLRR